jgi:hypothetical protein
VQILTVLPNPPVQVMKEIQDIFYKFLSYLPHIFLYNLEVTFSMGTYSSDQEVYQATTFLVLYRKIQYVAILTPLLHGYL